MPFTESLARNKLPESPRRDSTSEYSKKQSYVELQLGMASKPNCNGLPLIAMTSNLRAMASNPVFSFLLPSARFCATIDLAACTLEC